MFKAGDVVRIKTTGELDRVLARNEKFHPPLCLERSETLFFDDDLVLVPDDVTVEVLGVPMTFTFCGTKGSSVAYLAEVDEDLKDDLEIVTSLMLALFGAGVDLSIDAVVRGLATFQDAYANLDRD